VLVAVGDAAIGIGDSKPRVEPDRFVKFDQGEIVFVLAKR
jgi:hypothetical protein